MDKKDKDSKKVAEQDLEITRFKGSGPGGQNRNKRETGIRIKHIPTGVTVSATERRSQGQNLGMAYERLEDRLERLRAKPKPRRKTKPTKSSQRRRVDSKKHQGTKKQSRSRNFHND